MNSEDHLSDSLEPFLDGMLSDEDAQRFLVKSDAESVADAQALQGKIDDSLRRMYKFEPLDSGREQEIARQAFQNDSESRSTRGAASSREGLGSPDADRRRFLVTALAASLLAISAAGLWFLANPDSSEPFFESRAVASLYEETVNAGFQPYYNCEDDQRFANTFEFRQGIPLKLADLPAGTRMLGLSYLGGMSRDTTAMLGEADGQKVIVFVDRVSSGKLIVTTNENSDLNVFVVERDGLVFAEVSPLSESKFIQHLSVTGQ
jgi:hypothetical protein